MDTVKMVWSVSPLRVFPENTSYAWTEEETKMLISEVTLHRKKER